MTRAPDHPPDDSVLITALATMAALVSRPVDDAEYTDEQLVTVLTMVRDLVPGALWATMTAVSADGEPEIWHASDPSGTQADALQHGLGEGPTVDSVRNRRLVVADDLGTDPRWPRFGPQITAATPVRAVLSVPVGGPGSVLGSVTLYGDAGHHFTDDATQVAVTMAATALAGLTQRARAAALHRSLLTNRHIGIAVGMLMARHQWTQEQAFAAFTAARDAEVAPG